MKTVKPGEMVFVAGRTGTGKTYLAKKYLANVEQRVWVLDTKGTFIWKEVAEKEQRTIKNLSEIAAKDTKKLIYKPVPEEMNDDFYEAFFAAAYRLGNVIVLVDECMSVCDNPHKIPFSYKAILTRGRELGVSVWTLTQRPSGIPQVTMSESTHFFIFDLNMPQDRQKLVDITGALELANRPSLQPSGNKYSFWYYNINWEGAKLAQLVERKG